MTQKIFQTLEELKDFLELWPNKDGTGQLGYEILKNTIEFTWNARQPEVDDLRQRLELAEAKIASYQRQGKTVLYTDEFFKRLEKAEALLDRAQSIIQCEYSIEEECAMVKDIEAYFTDKGKE